MKAEVWLQVDKVFQAAIELEPARRAAFLDVACSGDQFLRSEVETLLTADSFEWGFIDTPALESAAILLADAEPRLTPGQHLGHYEIQELIGKGGMGEVYLARDLVLNRNVALKLLPLDYKQNDDRLQRFKREAETVSALNHPNIITIHELGSDDGHGFIATELIEGETLREHIKRGPLSGGDALEVAIQTAAALAAAHRAGIVHRDIKPENIMLRPDGYVKVLDFGLAKLAEQQEPRLQPTGVERTDISSGLLMGTIRYMSPEQVSGSPLDARTDVFSLGVVLYELVTGRPPFDEGNAAKHAESILKDHPNALGTDLDTVPDLLRGVVTKMLSKDRDGRYQNADELIDDLKLLKKQLVLDPKASDGARAVLLRRRSLAVVLLVVSAFASAIGFASYKFLRSSPPAVRSLSEKGRWAAKAPISSPRYQAEPAVLNGMLYVAGGWNVCTPFSDLKAYDSETDTWKQRAPMHTPRGAHGVGVLDGKLYAVGGFVDCGIETSSVETYDPARDSWSVSASLPAPRAGHVVAAANGRLYAIGGWLREYPALTVNSEYDPNGDTWMERAPMPTARLSAAAAVVRGIIYVIGGQNESGPLSTVEAYDPKTNSWTSKHPMLSPRSGFAASELNGIIYALGGRSSHLQVEAYDPATDTWTAVAQMPGRRSDMHAVAFRGSIYFAGGFDQTGYLTSVIAFTPESVAGSTAGACPTVSITGKAPMLTARSSMATGEINGIVYVVGGMDENAAVLASNEAYDPIADMWTRKAPMPTARETRASNDAVVGERLYVIGGRAGGQCTDLNQAYDPKTDTWATYAPMPTPRCHLAAVAVSGLIYALGGTNTNGSIKYTIVEIYDPSTDTWTTGPPMPTGRQDIGAAVLNGILHTFGGWDPSQEPEDLDVVEAYDPVSKVWSTKAPMPTRRGGTAVGVLNGSFIVAGGGTSETPSAVVEAYDPVSDAWTILESMPAARGLLSGVTANNTFYLFGGLSTFGSNGSVATNDAMTLQPCSDQQR